MTTTSDISYIQRAITEDGIEAPIKLQDTLDEIRETLYQENRTGGAVLARQAWERLCQAKSHLAQLFLPTELPAQVPASRLIHVGDLDTLRRPAFLIPHEIPEGSFIAIYGASGVGKSFLGLDYAAKIALQGKPVIYIAAEGRSGYRDRMKVYAHYHNIDRATLPIQFLFDAPDLGNPGQVEQLIEEFRLFQPSAIFVDTLARCMTGDENSSKDMSSFIRGCDMLRQRLQTAVIVLHHKGKTGSSERGSSALRGAADVMIELTDKDVVLEISCDKMKDAPEFSPRYVQLEVVKIAPDETSCVIVHSARRPQINPNKLRPAFVKILESLSQSIFRQAGAKANQLKEDTGCATSTVNTALSNLKDLGYIIQSKKGDPYYITETGSTALKEALGE